MTTEPGPRAGELAWRSDDHERRLKLVEERVEHVPVLEERIAQLTERMAAVTRALWTVAGGLVLLVISVLIAAAQFGGG